MKVIIIFSLIVTMGKCVLAQSPYADTMSCSEFRTALLGMIDSTYSCCDTANTNFNLIIEPSAANMWQKGKTYKFGIADTRDTTCALFTDSAATYLANNYSAAYLILPETPNQWNNFSYYLTFWHKYTTDSLLDGCWLEFSVDSGANWFPADSFLHYSLPNIYAYCNLYGVFGSVYSSGFDTLLNGRKAWSGVSDGWEYTALLFNFQLPFKPRRNNSINAVRFVFQSDSIQNNKPGWIISDISTGYVNFAGGQDNIHLVGQLPVSPNPSASGLFHFTFPETGSKGSLYIFDIYGRLLMDLPMQKLLDLSGFANGVYYYRATFDAKSYSGVLNKN